MYSRAQYEGKVCPTCNLTKLGQDAMGLSIQLEGGASPAQGAGAGQQINTGEPGVEMDPMAAVLSMAAGLNAESPF